MPLGIECEFGGLFVVAAVAVRHEARRALVGPFHRTAEQFRGVQDADVFRIDRRLHAERTADVAGEDVHLVRRGLHGAGHAGLQPHHALADRMQRVALFGLVVFADGGAGLHRVDDQPRVENFQLHLVRGAGEGGGHLLGVAVVIVERDVVGDILEDRRRAVRVRLGEVDHHGQRLDVEFDRFSGVLGLQQRIRHHAGDRIAHEADFVGRQHGAARLLHVGAVAALEWQRRLDGAVGLQSPRRCRRRGHPAFSWRRRC